MGPIEIDFIEIRTKIRNFWTFENVCEIAIVSSTGEEMICGRFYQKQYLMNLANDRVEIWYHSVDDYMASGYQGPFTLHGELWLVHYHH